MIFATMSLCTLLRVVSRMLIEPLTLEPATKLTSDVQRARGSIPATVSLDGRTPHSPQRGGRSASYVKAPGCFAKPSDQRGRDRAADSPPDMIPSGKPHPILPAAAS